MQFKFDKYFFRIISEIGKYTETFKKNYIEKIKNKINVRFGGDLSNALCSGSFFLIIFKIYFFLYYGTQLSSINNLILLIIFSILSFKFNIFLILRYGCYKIIRKTLGAHFLGFPYETWQNVYDEIQLNGYFPDDYVPSRFIKVPKETYFNKFFIIFYSFLIQLRLFIFAEPYFFFFVKFLLFIFLIQNNFLIITYIITMLIILSRILLVVSITYLNSFFIMINNLCELNLKEDERIAPTQKNAFIILMIITEHITTVYSIFKVHTKNTKIINEFYAEDLDIIDYQGAKIFWQLRNYKVSQLNNGMKIYIEKKIKNSYLSTSFFIFLLFIIISFISIKLQIPYNYNEQYFELEIFTIIVFQLHKKKTEEFYKLLEYKNLHHYHPGFYILKFKKNNQFDKNYLGEIWLSNLTTKNDTSQKPNLDLHSVDSNSQFVGYVGRGYFSETAYEFLKQNGTEIKTHEINFSSTFTHGYDAKTLSFIYKEAPQFRSTFFDWKNLNINHNKLVIPSLFKSSRNLLLNPTKSIIKNYESFYEKKIITTDILLKNCKNTPYERFYKSELVIEKHLNTIFPIIKKINQDPPVQQFEESLEIHEENLNIIMRGLQEFNLNCKNKNLSYEESVEIFNMISTKLNQETCSKEIVLPENNIYNDDDNLD